jgi:putative endonuclease
VDPPARDRRERALAESRSERGRGGEEIAWDHLRRAGYTLVERNARTRFGEIDLIVEQRGTVVFVEVRSRTSARFGTALESIDGRKRRRLALLAADYLAKRRLEDRRARFDVIAIEWQDGAPMIDHVENAFEAP